MTAEDALMLRDAAHSVAAECWQVFAALPTSATHKRLVYERSAMCWERFGDDIVHQTLKEAG